MPTTNRDSEIRPILEKVRAMAAKIAMRLPKDVSFEDLVAAGNLGVATALSRHARPVSSDDATAFEAFAMLHARGAIFDELRRQDPLSRSARAEQRRVVAATRKLRATLGKEPDSAEIADEMGVDLETLHALRAYGSCQSVSVDALCDSDSHQRTEEIALVDDRAGAEEEMCRRQETERLERVLWEKVAEMPEREARVLTLVYKNERLLSEIGKDFGVTEGRISQIRKAAIASLRTTLTANDQFSSMEVA